MIEKILSEQMEKAQAKLILLLDTSGQVISFQGRRGNIDLVALGALAAADMAASQEMARISDLYQENPMIIREGSKVNTIIYQINRDFILLCMVPSSVPMGWFCYLVRNTAEQVKQVVIKVKKNTAELKLDDNSENFAAMVSDALNQVWKD